MSKSVRIMSHALYRTVAILAIVGLMMAGSTHAGLAAGPRATFPCGSFTKMKTNIATCHLTGFAFQASEKVSVTYRIEINWKQSGKLHKQVLTYHHSSTTDSKGTFKRPPLQFYVPVGKNVRLTLVTVRATLVGARGDHVTVVTGGTIH